MAATAHWPQTAAVAERQPLAAPLQLSSLRRDLPPTEGGDRGSCAGNYYKLLMPTLLARLSEYMVEPYGTPPDRDSTRSIVYESSVTIRPRPSPPPTNRIRTYYASSSRDSVEHQFVGWIVDTEVVQYLERLGSYFVSPSQTEKTIISQFGCSPRAIMLSDRAEDPLVSAATVALTILGLLALGLFGVPLARPVAMIMAAGFLAAWLGHAYGTSSFCLPAIPTAAPVDLLDMINRYTPAVHVHSLMLDQLTEGTSYDSPDDSPSERCRKLGFENSIDSLIYLLSVSCMFLYSWGWSCFHRRFSSANPAAPPFALFALLEITLSTAWRR